mmetsp:Transcript_57651/g.106075  ORF Transcript_57651/g.106075 Transcript_57651/m.106075 type:complete len:204 (+) Transcript_57651:3-614(+)
MMMSQFGNGESCTDQPASPSPASPASAASAALRSNSAFISTSASCRATAASRSSSLTSASSIFLRCGTWTKTSALKLSPRPSASGFSEKRRSCKLDNSSPILCRSGELPSSPPAGSWFPEMFSSLQVGAPSIWDIDVSAFLSKSSLTSCGTLRPSRDANWFPERVSCLKRPSNPKPCKDVSLFSCNSKTSRVSWSPKFARDSI